VGEREEPFDRLRGDILRRMSRAQLIEKKRSENGDWRQRARRCGRGDISQKAKRGYPLFFVSDRNEGLEVLSFLSVLK
jgi:hypothetical protein